MDKKKILKIVGIIILVLVVIFLIHVIKNFIILSTIQEKVAKYYEPTNVHYTLTSVKGQQEDLSEVYIKDGHDSKTIMNHFKDKQGNESKIIQVVTQGERRLYTETKDSKTVKIYHEDNSNSGMRISVYDGDKIRDSILLLINTEKIDGKDYYVLNGPSDSVLYDQNATETKMYIEKDTGLITKITEKVKVNDEMVEYTYTYKYEFDVVTDADIAGPDISEYTIKEN